MVAMAAVRKSALRVRAPSQERGEATVKAIRVAAEKMLSTRAFAEVSVTGLAKKAGIGVGTFYHFYPSKEALLLDLREQLFQRSVTSLSEHLPSEIRDGKAFLRALERLLTDWIAMSVRMRGLERAVAALSFENPAFAAALRAQELPVQQLAEQILMQHRALLRDIDPPEAARAILILVDAVVARAMREPELAEHPGPVVKEVARMIARYLLPPGGRR